MRPIRFLILLLVLATAMLLALVRPLPSSAGDTSTGTKPKDSRRHAQRRPVEEAARDLQAMCEQGLALGLRVALADVLPWPNGDARAAREIARLNELIGLIPGVVRLPFQDTLAGVEGWSDDGDHPSVEGYRLLGERAFRLG